MMYDEELMADDIRAMLLANLDGEIDKLNAEKNDSLVLEKIPESKYVYETLGSDMLNFKGFFLMYGLMNPGQIQQASNGTVVENTAFSVEIATFDSGDKTREDTLKKLLRYRRVLRQLVINNPDVFRGYAKSSLASLSPNAFAFNPNSIVITCGITIQASVVAV